MNEQTCNDRDACERVPGHRDEHRAGEKTWPKIHEAPLWEPSGLLARRLGHAEPARAAVWFAVCDVAAHEGHITSEWADNVWGSGHESGWTYQEVTGAHGRVLYEGPDEEEARAVLAKWLECDSPEKGTYCYAHNPRPAS